MSVHSLYRRSWPTLFLTALWVATMGLVWLGALVEALGQRSPMAVVVLLAVVAVVTALLLSALHPRRGLTRWPGLVLWLISWPVALSALRPMLGLPAVHLLHPRHAAALGSATGIVLAAALVLILPLRVLSPRPIETALADWPRTATVVSTLLLLLTTAIAVAALRGDGGP